MTPTFEQLQEAAKQVHRRFFRTCTSSFDNIADSRNVRDLRLLAIRYRDYISDPDVADYIRARYEDVLEALGLRFQLYVDGRVRLYLTN